MSQKKLLALDGSENSMQVVEYVAKTVNPGDKITLYSVLPDVGTVCDMYEPSLTPLFTKHQSAFCALEDSKKDMVNVAMEKAKQILIKASVPSEDINIKLENQVENIANHIIKEAKEGKYDAIFLGKRGLSRFTELLMGSVSNKVVHLAKDIVVTIVAL